MTTVIQCSSTTHLTTAFFITVVLAVLLPITNPAGIDTLARIAHVLLWCTGWLRRDTQNVCLIRAIHAVALSVAGEGSGDAGSVSASELAAAAGVIGTAQLITAVPTVIHTVTAEEEVWRKNQNKE